MSPENGVIYSIAYKATGQVVYVGQTRQKPRLRWMQHMRGRSPISKLLQFIGSMDAFEFKVVEHVADDSDLGAREIYWIDALNTRHPNGLNHMEGGNHRSHSAATRARMSAHMKTVCADPTFVEKISPVRKALWQDPEYRAKTEAGIKRSRKCPGYQAKQTEHMHELWSRPSHRAIMTKSAQAQWADPDTRAKMSASISAAHKARWADPATRARLIAGRKATKERKELLALASCL